MADFDFGQADEEELQYKSFWERLRESFSKFNNCLRHVIWSNACSLMAPKRISRGPILFLGTEQIISDILFIIVVAHLHTLWSALSTKMYQFVPFPGNHFTSGGSDLVSEGSSVSGRLVLSLSSVCNFICSPFTGDNCFIWKLSCHNSPLQSPGAAFSSLVLQGLVTEALHNN